MTTFDKAPLPPHKGTMLDTVTLIGDLGRANFAQIATERRAKNLPGITVKQLTVSLSNAVYRGYLTLDNTGEVTYWKVAPKSYWRARNAKVKAAYQASKIKKYKHATYIKAKAKKKRKLTGAAIGGPRITIPVSKAPNGLLRAVDFQIRSLSAQERGIHNKIDKLRKVRANIAMLEL